MHKLLCISSITVSSLKPILTCAWAKYMGEPYFISPSYFLFLQVFYKGNYPN